MSNGKIVSLVDNQLAKSRQEIGKTLARLQIELSVEMGNIKVAIAELQREIDRLKGKPLPAVDPRLAQDKRSDIVDAAAKHRGGGLT
jgi:hypothetical protein